jgi:molybdopterin-synthase adenylyltransferase
MTAPSSRYDRQIRLAEIGESGQQALRKAKVAVVGLGALGSVAADLLARAGIGELVLIDRDVVDWSNLQRQMLYVEKDAAQAVTKADAALQRLKKINSEVQCHLHAVDLSYQNLNSIMEGVDLIVDGTDNFATRYLLNDYAVKHQLPYVYAGVVSTYGMVASIQPQSGPCLRCTYPEPPDASQAPTCSSAGVLGPAVAVISGMASAEAIKILVGNEALHGFQYFDLWRNQFHAMKAKRDENCPCCGKRKFDWLLGKQGSPAAQVMCGGNTVQIPAQKSPPDLELLEEKLAGTVTSLSRSPQFLRFTHRNLDVLIFADGRALLRGTEDPAIARSVLAETVGS